MMIRSMCVSYLQWFFICIILYTNSTFLTSICHLPYYCHNIICPICTLLNRFKQFFKCKQNENVFLRKLSQIIGENILTSDYGKVTVRL